MTALFILLRCRLLGHAAHHFAGTFYVTCERPGCDAVGRLA